MFGGIVHILWLLLLHGHYWCGFYNFSSFDCHSCHDEHFGKYRSKHGRIPNFWLPWTSLMKTWCQDASDPVLWRILRWWKLWDLSSVFCGIQGYQNLHTDSTTLMLWLYIPTLHRALFISLLQWELNNSGTLSNTSTATYTMQMETTYIIESCLSYLSTQEAKISGIKSRALSLTVIHIYQKHGYNVLPLSEIYSPDGPFIITCEDKSSISII